MTRKLSITHLLMGFLAGVFFVAACPDPSASDDDSASTSSAASSSGSSGLGMATAQAETTAGEPECATWEVEVFAVPDGGTTLPSGWFPFAGNANFGNNVFARRCAS